MRYVMLVLAILLASNSGFASESSHEPTPLREGTVELGAEEAASLFAEVAHDLRYEALRQVAEDRWLRAEPGRVRGFVFPEGHRVVFVPVADQRGEEKGFFSIGAGRWTLSLSVSSGSTVAFEGLEARFGLDGRAVVQVGSTPPPVVVGSRASAMSSLDSASSCLYVASYGISYGCWSDGNPFAYYHLWMYRFGTTPDPMSPSWWACWQGYIHVCPQYEDAGSPWVIPVCGFPPSHPQG